MPLIYLLVRRRIFFSLREITKRGPLSQIKGDFVFERREEKSRAKKKGKVLRETNVKVSVLSREHSRMTTTTIFFGCLLHSLCKKQNRQIKRDRLGRTRRPDRLLRGRQGDKKWQEEEAYSKNENVFFFLSEKTSNSFCSAKCTAGNLLSRLSSSFFVFRTRCEKKRRIDEEEEVGLKEREGQVKETQDTTQLN